ncbi:hypothetical protein ACFE04_027946 [Oxalis oulophora]
MGKKRGHYTSIPKDAIIISTKSSVLVVQSLRRASLSHSHHRGSAPTPQDSLALSPTANDMLEVLLFRLLLCTVWTPKDILGKLVDQIILFASASKTGDKEANPNTIVVPKSSKVTSILKERVCLPLNPIPRWLL